MTAPLQYRICALDPAAHLFAVTCTVAGPAAGGQLFSLPAWIPGSYMIRDFARHIVAIRAEAGGRAVALEKLDKQTWRAAPVPGGQALSVHCEVYAWDLSVRSAHLDRTHGFFNGSSVFLRVHGQEHCPCEVDILPPADAELADWRVITAMPPAGGVRSHAFGRYRAADYEELIDHPVEMGRFTVYAFEAAGVAHEIALSGRHDCDGERLCADLARICQWQIDLFGAPPPMDYYAFLTMVVGEGYGGLEHRASTALLTSRADLPWQGMKVPTDGYRQFLGLCSHEYFHTWNVKRIKPAAFVPYDLSRENHTALLWAFEGFTSYYDDLALVRSGVIGVDDYLGLLGKSISAVLRGPGRKRQSLAESSFDAWTKYYRQDENTPNEVVSYYAKGALVALALDLQLRAAGQGGSLDEVMRVLWRRHGSGTPGVPEDGIFAAVAEVGGTALARWLRRAVEGTADLPLARLLKSFGIGWRAAAAAALPWLGVKFASGAAEARLATVYSGAPAQRAGLAAGDVLVAIDGLKAATANAVDALLGRRRPGERVQVHAFRRDELMCFEVELGVPPADQVTLAPLPRASVAAQQLRRAWLGQ